MKIFNTNVSGWINSETKAPLTVDDIKTNEYKEVVESILVSNQV